MDYGYPSATMKNASASPSKQGGKWRLTKKSSDSEGMPSTGLMNQPMFSGCEEQLRVSPQKQKKGFKISLPKKALEKKKGKKKENEQDAMSDLGSSHHTARSNEFDMVGGLLPPWENPTLVADDSSIAAAKPNQAQMQRRSAILSTKTRRNDDSSPGKRGVSNRSVLSSKSIGSKNTQSNQMSRGSLGLDCCESSSSSISLEDIGCINLDGSSSATQGVSITDKSSASAGNMRNSGRIPALPRTVSGDSAASSRGQPILRRLCSNGITSASDSDTKLSQPTSHTTASRKETTTSSLNASMDLGDIFNDSDIKISIEGKDDDGNVSKHEKSQSNHNHRRNKEEELLEQENEMLRLAMERSVHDLSVTRSTSGGSTNRGTRQRLQQPAARSRVPPKTASHGMNRSMDLHDILGAQTGTIGSAVTGLRASGDDDDNMDEQEHKMLEIALHRSVQDIGGLSRSVARSGPPARHVGTRNNMSMDLTAVFEENAELNIRRRIDDHLPRLKEPGISHDRSNGGYRTKCQGRDCEGGAEWPSHDDSEMLAQQEAEMLRLAMERSMHDFGPPSSPLRQAHLSPRRAVDREAYRRSANTNLIQSLHIPADENPSYTYSHVKRHPSDLPSPQRSYSSSDDDSGQRRHLRADRRNRQSEPPVFCPHTYRELSSIKEQEQAMLDEAISRQSQHDYRHTSRNT